MLQNKNRKKCLGLLLMLLLIVGYTDSTFHELIQFPSEIRLLQGEWKKLNFTIPVSVKASVDNPQIVSVNGTDGTDVPISFRQPLSIQSSSIGKTQVTLKLFGSLPIKQWKVQVYPDIRVIPGGQSIGVKMKSEGVLVVGLDAQVQPEKQKVQVGDYLLQVNGHVIREMRDVSQAVQEAGKKDEMVRLTVSREGKTKQIQLHPYYDKKEKQFRLGFYIRDSAAGVGTLTFMDPKHHVYGALGHLITDMDTGQPIRVGSGKLIHSNVTSIQKGETGEPGEKRAIFFDERKVLGNITKNTPFGIFGKTMRKPDQGLLNQPVPVAFAEEVKEGPAKILTVIEGQKVEAFNIQISHVMKQKYPATKGLILKVTDPRLLNKTGGIVQGMSGSPILQDGKLVGAVTHVFVNDPSSGYGTFIEWMLNDAGVIQKKEGSQRGSSFFAGKERKMSKMII